MTGWQKIDDTWHYYDSATYAAAVGAQKIDGVTYLFDYTGAQKTGWRTVDGVRRYYDPETGKPVEGWVSYGGSRYYVDDAAGKVTGEYTVDGVRYLLDEETGTQKLGLCIFDDQTVRYYDANGELTSGWAEDGENRYYFSENYEMQTGWADAGRQALLLRHGRHCPNRHPDRGRANSTALPQTLLEHWFQAVGSQKYYFGTDGAMLTGLADHRQPEVLLPGKRQYGDGNGHHRRKEVHLQRRRHAKENQDLSGCRTLRQIQPQSGERYIL